MKAPLYGWLGAQIVSATGTRLSMIAVPWFVLTTTGSATRTGLVAFAEITPYVALKALGGPLLDRIGPRRVSVTCDWLSVAAVGAVPLLFMAGWLPFPVLLLLVAFTGAFRGPGDGAKQALVPGVSISSGAPVERVTGLANATDRLAGLFGAAIGGVLIAAFGAPFALSVDAASFAVAALLIGLTAPGGVVPAVLNERGSSYGAALRTGWSYVRRDRLLLALTLMVGLTNLLDQAYFTVLLPVWALAGGRGSEAVGLILAVSGAGAVAGSLLASVLGARLPRYITFVVAFLLAGGPRFVVLGFDTSLAAILSVTLIGGFAGGFLNPLIGAMMIERIPPALYGRVSSLTASFCWALMPLGGLVAGWLIAGLTLSPALIVCGAAYFAFTLLPVMMPDFKVLDQRPPASPPASPPVSAESRACVDR